MTSELDSRDMSEYDRHRVSCKIVLFNPDRTKVLLTKYDNGDYGIPGGHVDGAEQPDDALVRELKEELGIDYDGPLLKRDFWRTKVGKIVLGYVGMLDDDAVIEVDDVEQHEAVWIPIENITESRITAGEYDHLILDAIALRHRLSDVIT